MPLIPRNVNYIAIPRNVISRCNSSLTAQTGWMSRLFDMDINQVRETAVIEHFQSKAITAKMVTCEEQLKLANEKIIKVMRENTDQLVKVERRMASYYNERNHLRLMVLKTQGLFNIRGVLEYVAQAGHGEGVQKKLNDLAKTTDFSSYLGIVANATQLNEATIMSSHHSIYSTVCKYFHENKTNRDARDIVIDTTAGSISCNWNSQDGACVEVIFQVAAIPYTAVRGTSAIKYHLAGPGKPLLPEFLPDGYNVSEYITHNFPGAQAVGKSGDHLHV